MSTISSNVCEICSKPAKVATNDKDTNLHFSCIDHIKQLWEKLGKP